MNCFYHPTVPALGICKSCGKGLCVESAVDLGKGLACKGHCEKDVKDLIKVMDRAVQRSPVNERILQTARKNRVIGAGFYLAIGLLFIGFTLYRYFSSCFESPDVLLAGMGICFLAYGVFALRQALRVPK